MSVELGFGTLRLPVREGCGAESGDIDLEKTITLFDAFIARGGRFFDTAYIYHAGRAESAVRECLVKRYPRDAFKLASKLPIKIVCTANDMERVFSQQLENCGVDYFDAYLLHGMGEAVSETAERCGAYEFLAGKKREGLAKSLGLSFHGGPVLLDELLSRYRELFDYVQLQVNYLDFDDINVQSRRCLQVANSHDMPVAVMEPCKGGTLAHPPKEERLLLERYAPEASAASWAMRFAASQKGVFRVLSGMNTLEQVTDNTAIFDNMSALNGEENALLIKAAAMINAQKAVKCGGCVSCGDICPQKIPIREYIELFNSMHRTTCNFSSQAAYYRHLRARYGAASACTSCGVCSKTCPEGLDIAAAMRLIAAEFE